LRRPGTRNTLCAPFPRGSQALLTQGPEISPREDGPRLDSWKEIAAHLHRGVTTVQRWERTEGLPVHRLPHAKAGSIYAYPRELDAWWRERSARLDVPDPPEAAAGPMAPPPSRFPALLIALACLAIVFLAAAALLLLRPSAPRRAMLAVLPFQNLSESAEDEYLADSVTEELTTVVARLNPERLGVIARTSVMPYKAHPKPVSAIGRELKVDYVLEGSVRQSAGRLRVTAQLIEVAGQSHLWAQAYEKELAGVFGVESDLAEAIAQRLSIRLLPGPPLAAASPDPEAHAAYLKGLYFWNKRDEEGLRRAIALFRQALDADPSYARAYAGLASSYALLATSADALRSEEARDLSVAAAQRALQLQPDLPEGHAALSIVRCRFDWDWTGCQRELERTIELDPNYASGHFWLGEHLIQRGRFAEAEASLKKASLLDPLSPVIHTHLGINSMYAGRYEEALASYQQALEIAPRFLLAHRVRGLTLLRAGRTEDGLAALRQAREIDPASAHAAADLAYALARAGRTDEARARLREMEEMHRTRRVSAYDFAVVHAGLGESGAALDRLEQAFAERGTGVRWLKVEPIFATERADPRFRALVARMGLPD